jgi:hypothetical protein
MSGSVLDGQKLRFKINHSYLKPQFLSKQWSSSNIYFCIFFQKPSYPKFVVYPTGSNGDYRKNMVVLSYFPFKYVGF